jgi:hypothetical protein
MKKTSLFLILASALLASCDKNDNGYDGDGGQKDPQIEVNISKSSGDSATIIGTINQFRKVLGDSLNTTPGKTSGRREVNWDGVPADLVNNDQFPLDFFNNTDPAGPAGRKRGLVYLNAGSALRVDSSSFSDIDASYADEFQFFSRKKLIAAATSNISEIVFKVAGTNTDAFVKGFGVIFTDVDDAASTYVEFYDGAKLLGKFNAPARTNAGSFSFLGIHFPADKITKIRITAGNGVLAQGNKDISQGGSKDLVVFDDVFYDEPQQLQ